MHVKTINLQNGLVIDIARFNKSGLISMQMGAGNTSMGYLMRELTRSEALAVLDEMREAVAALPEHGTKPEIAERRQLKKT